jgi:hypothetical protein
MTDTTLPPKPRRTVRSKGTPPKPGEVLGALVPPPAKPTRKAVAKKPAAAAVAAPRPHAKVAKPAKAVSVVAPAVPEKPAKPAKPASERTKPLNFRVTNEFRKAFKQAAAAEDCKKVELLERIFADWQAAHAR